MPRGAAGASTGLRWQVEWHPANGGRVRGLGVSRRAALRFALVLAIASSAVAAGGLAAGLDRMRAGDELAAARHENRILQARQAALREDVREPAERSDFFGRGSKSGATFIAAQ